MTIQIHTNQFADNIYFVPSHQTATINSPFENPVPLKLDNKYLLSQEKNSLWSFATQTVIAKGGGKGVKDVGKKEKKDTKTSGTKGTDPLENDEWCGTMRRSFDFESLFKRVEEPKKEEKK